MMKRLQITLSIIAFLIILTGCDNTKIQINNSNKLSVIFDTDANNELDDQHALAYLLFNSDTFKVLGVTVNTTYNGGDIDDQYAEAERILKLCNSSDKIPLLKGANGSFDDIKNSLFNEIYDGSDAVNFIINQAKEHDDRNLVLIAVGKLTNIALAVMKDSSITEKIRLVWLGANYPESGEYNLENDIPSMNYLLKSNIHFEMVTVRYGQPSGTDAVRITKDEVLSKMPGIGPQITDPIIGRHGGSFVNFGDYSISLFKNTNYDGEPPSRALFDMAAVAIVKNSNWAESSIIPCPIMEGKQWIDQPNNLRKIIIWENFKKESIMFDFFDSLKNYKIVKGI